jgi:hypothetical protein
MASCITCSWKIARRGCAEHGSISGRVGMGSWRAMRSLRLQVGMDHAALDRPGPHDGHLHHQVVAAGLQPRQHAHLGAGFDLETPIVSARQIMS